MSNYKLKEKKTYISNYKKPDKEKKSQRKTIKMNKRILENKKKSNTLNMSCHY